VGGLEAELPDRIPYRLNILLEYGAVARGQDWSAIRKTLLAWILEKSSFLPDGRHLLDIPGIPFQLCVTKESDRPTGVFFSRSAPEDNSLPLRIHQQFEEKKKIKKLAKYKKLDFTTIILVESDDIALMNEIIMLKTIREAYPQGLPRDIDELWFADTSIPSEVIFYNFTQKLRNEKNREILP
jgi:hypothetical protein